jgi:phosphatidylglycerophosphate synthase
VGWAGVGWAGVGWADVRWPGVGWAWVALGVAAAGLLVATVLGAGARAGGSELPDRVGYFRRWAVLHGGYDPAGTAFTGRWLALVHRLAAPLARRGVSPTALTGWGLLVSAAVPLVAAGGWPFAAIPVLVAAGLLDSLDGAVAVLTDRTTRAGYVLDSTADRLSDAAYVLALWPLGAPGWLVAAGGALAWLPEYVRARVGAAGMTELAVLTVWERPTRIVLLAAGLLPGHPAVATAGAGGWAGFGAVATVQLLVVTSRRLRT